MYKYLYILEKTATGYSAYVPDLPGCVAAGETADETNHSILEAIEFHLDGLREEGYEIPLPLTTAAYAEVQTA